MYIYIYREREINYYYDSYIIWCHKQTTDSRSRIIGPVIPREPQIKSWPMTNDLPKTKVPVFMSVGMLTERDRVLRDLTPHNSHTKHAVYSHFSRGQQIRSIKWGAQTPELWRVSSWLSMTCWSSTAQQAGVASSQRFEISKAGRAWVDPVKK